MTFSKKFLIGSFVLILMVLGGYAIYSRSNPSTSVEQGQASVAEETLTQDPSARKNGQAYQSLDKSFGSKETPIPVSAEPVQFGTLIQKVIAQGQVYSYQKADLVSEVSGKLVALHVHDGQRVAKGDLLAEIDDRAFQLAYEEAQARYLSAVADYLVYEQSSETVETAVQAQQERREEIQKKLKAGDISEENYRQKSFLLDLESIKSGGRRSEVVAARTLDQARIQKDKAKLDWDKCQIKAPFNGVIFNVQVTEGQLISSNTQLFHLMNMEDLVVKARVLESEIGQIEEGREAAIEFPALADLGSVKGKIKAVSPYVNPSDKTIETVLSIDSTSPRILPGMFAEVHLDATVYENQLMVPKNAILPRDDRKVIFVVGDDSRAKWLYVKTGPENESMVTITDGKLKEGDMVLTDNHFTMGHGTLVSVSKKKQ
ncbi:MAG: hypothetical protein CR997_00900 [Acidobacteria bacterium]|nr:MAG: hypothetical protein CR997_00900 [Acidobacteriota bacterium]